MKKGIVHLIPLIAIAITLGIAGIGIAAKQRSQNSAPSVLSSSDNRGKSVSGQNSNSGRNSDNKPSSSAPGPANGREKIEIKIGPKKTEIKIRDGEIKFELKTKETNQIVTFEATGGATASAGLGKKVRTNFPITVNPLTNEKIVTTPSGVHIVILPEVAIQNMIKAGFPVILLPEPSPSPSSSPEATPSATPSATPEASPEVTVPEEEIILTESNGELVYEIPAIKNQRFLGLVSVKIKVKGYVSAESGSILEIKKSLFDNILDFLSF